MSAPLKKTALNMGHETSSLPEANYRVLVVDDEIAIAKSIEELLTPPPSSVTSMPRSSRSKKEPFVPNPPGRRIPAFEVTIVHTANEAIDKVKATLKQGRPFAMGFFDVMLGGGMDGIDLVKNLQALDPHIYSVFVTAYHDRSVDTINEYLGRNNSDRWDYINKPFTEGEIVQKARNATSLYNLHRLKEWQEGQLGEAHRRLMQHERANAVSAVIRSVAHEFGNLLTHIVGHAELALLKKDPERYKESLEIILKASDTATSILGRFKKLADSGEAAGNKEILELALPIREALDLMAYQFKKDQIKVQLESFEGLVAFADHHSLVQVFVNLMINASHAMPKGGLIHISHKTVGDKIEIRIRDTGSGIPSEILDRVTEPLFTTKGKNGSGLGLSICKEIIEIEHHGDFKIGNHSSGGVEVVFLIPIREEN